MEPSNRERNALLKVEQVADVLNISERSVWRLASTGEIPAPISIGRSRRWHRRTIEAFIDAKIDEVVA